MLILSGGCDRKYPEYWRRLSEVITRETEAPHILSCLFSQEPEMRAEKHLAFDDYFRKAFGSDIEITHANEEEFYSQIDLANVIYLHGGRTDRLMGAISDVEKFKSLIRGKIVVGSSAGANFLTQVCYSPSKQSTIAGSGILPVGVVVHYGIEAFEDTNYTHEFWRQAVSQVRQELGAHAPLILLPEGQFVVIDDENY